MGTRDTGRSDLSPRKVAERIKEEGKQRLEQGKSTAAEQVESVASALKSAGSELDRSQPTLAAYANQLASTISQFGTRLRDGSIEELISDVQVAARRNPTLFVAGGFALGFALARLLKASATEGEQLVGSDYDEVDADLSGRNYESSIGRTFESSSTGGSFDTASSSRGFQSGTEGSTESGIESGTDNSSSTRNRPYGG